MNPNDGISIVICTHNGSKRIKPTLQAIFSLNTQSHIPWELIIVDNGSTDNTSTICKEFLLETDIQQKGRVVFEANIGCNFARLRGLYESQHTWILFCDDDNHLFPGYINIAWNILKFNSTIGALGGQGIALFEKGKPEWFDRYSKSFAIGPQAKSDGKLNSLSQQLYSAGTFFKKELLLNYYDNDFKTILIGPHGNDLTRGEDTEWCILIQLLGYELWYNSELKFHHWMPEVRMTWSYYLNLKKGITSGCAKLSSYALYYTTTSPTNTRFIFYYFYQCLHQGLIWIQFIVRNQFNKNRFSKEEIQLGKLVTFIKFKSFVQDFNTTYKHFKQIKAILNKIRTQNIT